MSLSRRNFLRTQGAVIALPFLPSIAPTLAAAPSREIGKPAKKLVMMYVPNGLVRRCFFPGEENGEIPGFVGGFNADKFKDEKRTRREPGIHPVELTSTMQPLADHARDISLITGLDRTYKDGQDVHAQGASCYLTSVSPEQAQGRGMRHPNGRSLDQIIGDHVGHGSVFNTLEISCNGFRAPKESIYFNNISWYGPDKIAPSIRDPQKLYERLFSADSYRNHIGDVTDLMLADARTLAKKLDRDEPRDDGWVHGDDPRRRSPHREAAKDDLWRGHPHPEERDSAARRIHQAAGRPDAARLADGDHQRLHLHDRAPSAGTPRFCMRGCSTALCSTTT